VGTRGPLAVAFQALSAESISENVPVVVNAIAFSLATIFVRMNGVSSSTKPSR
jgi:hypothetical protein